MMLVMDTEIKERCLMFSHVDDDAFGAKDNALIEWIFEKMREVFVMTGPDELLTFCGLNRVVDGDILILHGIPWIEKKAGPATMENYK
jgi:predicted metallo-beta-lactamase superfamily hydrolase